MADDLTLTAILKADASGMQSGFKAATQSMSGFKSAAASAGGGLKEIESAGGGMAGVLGGIGTALLAVGAVAVGVGIKSVKMAGDFQQSMTSLVTGAGEAQSNMGMVSKGILDMAVKTGTSTKQLADGMYMIESAGFHGADGLNVLKNAAEGAKVGNADLASVANGVTTALTDYQLPASKAASITNDLIATVASGKTTMGELSASLKDILPVASSAGIGLGDVSAAMATMTGEGVPASQAATYLRQTVLALEAPSSKGASALRSIGLSSQQVADAMKKSLPDALEMITNNLKKKFPEGSAAYISALKDISGGSKTMMGMLDLTGDHMKTFKDNVGNITDAVRKGGDGITGWALVTQNFNFKMAQAKEVVETLGIKIGTVLLPVVGAVVGGFTSAAQWIMSSMGTALTYVGNVLRSLDLTDFSAAWIDVKSAVRDTAQTFQMLGEKLKPISADVDPIADAIGTLAHSGLQVLTNMLWKAYEGISAFNAAFHGGGGSVADFGNSLKQLGPPLSHIADLLGGEFGKELRYIGEDAKQVGGFFMTSIVPALKQAEPGFLALGKVMLTQVIPAFIQIRGVVMDVLQHAFVVFAPIIEKVLPPLIVLSGVIANNVAGALKFLMPYVLQAAKAIGGFAEEIMDRVAPIVKGWIAGLTPLINMLRDNWNHTWPMMSGVLKGVWEMIVGVVKVAWALVSGIIKIGLDIIGGNWKKAWEDLKTTLSGVWDGIKTYLGGAFDAVKAMFTTIWANLSPEIKKPFEDAWNIISGIFDNIQHAINWVTGHGDTMTQEAANTMTGQHHFASGVENFKGGLAIVGEQGPELVNLPRGSSVLSNSKTMALMGQAKSTFQYPTPGSTGGSTGGGAPVIHVHVHPVVQPNDIYMDTHKVTSAIAPHMANMIRLKGDVRSR